MTFEYHSSTKDAYKSPDIAERYHSDFTGRLSWRRLRFRFVANRERHAVESMLRQVGANTVVDVPVGTGKLAPVLADGHYQVIAADVSEEMLEIARASYGQAGLNEATFLHCDVESLGASLPNGQVDLVICLRLMHRVPSDVANRMLDEISKIARFAIVSFGIDSPYQSFRRRVRNSIFGGGVGEDMCLRPLPTIVSDVSKHFEVMRRAWISPLISEEIVFLLKSKRR